MKTTVASDTVWVLRKASSNVVVILRRAGFIGVGCCLAVLRGVVGSVGAAVQVHCKDCRDRHTR